MIQSGRLIFLLVALLSVWLTACSNDVESSCLRVSDSQPSCSNPISVNFDELQTKSDTVFRLQQIDENQKEVHLVICTQAAYERYVVVNKGSLPALDFSQTILLAGRYIAPSSDFVKKQTITRCETGLGYQIFLAHGVSTLITNVYYFALVPRSTAPTSVAFEVKYD